MATRRSSKPHSAAATAAMPAGEGKLRYCAQPMQMPRVFDPNVPPGRASAILAFSKKWVNATQLSYYCFRKSDAVPAAWRGSPADISAVDKAFQQWADLGLGISFRAVTTPQDAQVRIGFDPSDGSWSYVGRDVLNIRDPMARTMNFGWALTTPYGYDTALHEIGHTLGLQHEHQNPNAGITWNRQAVLDYFRGPPNNWGEQQIEWNILRKIPPSEVKGTNWDPDSVMEYQFGPGLIDAPAAFKASGLFPKGGLSPDDVRWVRESYPAVAAAKIPVLQVGLSQLLQLTAGETRVFAFKPTRTRSYNVGTFGSSDTVMVLFEVTDQGNVEIAGNDDSGTDLNAKVKMRLQKGRNYQVGVRLYHTDAAAETALLVW